MVEKIDVDIRNSFCCRMKRLVIRRCDDRAIRCVSRWNQRFQRTLINTQAIFPEATGKKTDQTGLERREGARGVKNFLGRGYPPQIGAGSDWNERTRILGVGTEEI
jgi:hypothetical protein